jgi:acetyl esterase/lipase
MEDRHATFSYGESPEQEGDLWLPSRRNTPPSVVLIHGGCWRERYRRDLENDIAVDLVHRGFAVWNIEYRRLGVGGGWPESHDDVLAAVRTLQRFDDRLDPSTPALVGHSAGAHLALLTATELDVCGVVAQAPVADLRLAARLGSCRSTAETMLGQGAPSPVDRPPPVPHLVIHGDADDDVPVEIGRAYARAAPMAEYVELSRCGHYEHLDATSEAWKLAADWLEQLRRPDAGNRPTL